MHRKPSHDGRATVRYRQRANKHPCLRVECALCAPVQSPLATRSFFYALLAALKRVKRHFCSSVRSQLYGNTSHDFNRRKHLLTSSAPLPSPSAGTPVDRLDSFVQAYYARQASELQGQDGLPIASTSKIVSQNLDEAFMEFVWRQLILLPELKVAFLRKLDQSNAAAGGPAGPGNAQGTPQPDEADGATARDVEMGGTRNGSPEMDQGAYNLKNKAKIKAERAGAGGKKTARDARLMHDAWEFCELDPSEVEGVARAALVEKYGQERLRVAASPEACYVALTGSAERRSRLTHLTYQILQAIARGRENGKTVVDLGKEFDHDQKSLFHFVKSLVEMNFM